MFKLIFAGLLLARCLAFPQLLNNINIGNFDSNTVEDVSSIDMSYLSSEIDINFLHGVASGDPTNSSIILWTRVTPSTDIDTIAVFVAISEHETFENATKYTVLTSKQVDYTVKIDVEGLSPNKKYYYQFYTATGDSTRIGYTKTLPTEETLLDSLDISVHSCSNYAGGFFTSYAMAAVKDSVDFVIHLGDYIYEYKNGKYTNGTALGRTHMPNKELFELDDYRQRYASYRTDPDLQLSHGNFPWIVVWDDHELADNSWLRGSVNSHGIEFLKRKESFLQAYMEWMPIRPQSNLLKIWRPVNFGKLADLFMIDTRHYSRDVTDTYDNNAYIASIADRPERTMMGFDQEEWLYTSLANSESVWKLIGSQTVVNSVSFHGIDDFSEGPFAERNLDSFDGYTANRERFINAIIENNVQDVVLLSGDFHISWVHEIFARSEDYDFKTGDGSIMVEFAVTATSSPTTFSQNATIEQCYDISEMLVSQNEGLIWNEGWFRGYTEIHVTPTELTAQFYGVDLQNPDREEFLLATFVVEQGSNRVRRSFNDAIKYGYLDKKL